MIKTKIIKNLDIRSKVIFSILFTISLFFLNKVNIFLSIVVLIVYTLNADINKKNLIKLIKAMFLILLSIIGFNYFLFDTDIWSIVFMCYRLIGLSLVLFIFVENINIFDLADAFEKLLYPLTKLKIPIYDIGMIFTISIKFISIFFEEIERIKKSQRARGIIKEKMKNLEKLKSSLSLFLPMIICGLNHAFELSITMDLRGYHSGKKGRLKELKYQRKDYIFLLITIFFFIIQLIIK